MTFEPKSFNEIFGDMRGRTGSTITDFEVGSVARTLYESFSYEIALLYEKLHQVYLSAYIDTAQGQQLDMVVSILGISRNQPDFAAGQVTFERDVGNDDIEIPLNTLVATEDTEANPKKSYVTIEPAVLPKDRTTVGVKVQAIERGEEQATPAGTIVVMPQPVPGIKSVTNPEPLLFRGRQRETDAQLRERAKNALIASGKATIFSIENALLSLSGVTDIKIREAFHMARGRVIVTGSGGEMVVPKGARLTALVGQVAKPFETVETTVISGAQGELAVQSLLEGQAGQLFQTGDAVVWTFADEALNALQPRNLEPVLLDQFGIVEVYVDSVNFDTTDKETLATERARLQAAIDQVRAAGILVKLQPAALIDIDGVFRIELSASLSPSEAERAEMERDVAQALADYISGRKMGQPLLFSQMIKETLLLDGVDNLEDFFITALSRQEQRRNRFSADKKRIEIELFEKFKPRYICVASETKLLPVNIQFKVALRNGSGPVEPTASLLDEGLIEQVKQYLGQQFGELKAGQVRQSQIQRLVEQGLAQTGETGGQLLVADNTLELVPEPWCDRPLLVEEDGDTIIDVSFVEQPVLGDVFAYDKYLVVTGALKLTLPSTSTDAEKRRVRQQIERDLQSYFKNLKSEVDIVFEELIAIAAAVDPVLNVNALPEDFWLILDDGRRQTLDNDRIGPDKIDVHAFEKTVIGNLCLSSEVERVRVEATHVAIVATVAVAAIDPFATDMERLAREAGQAVRQGVWQAVNSALSDSAPGDDVVYDDFISAISDTVPQASYTVEHLALRATALADGRIQAAPPAIENQLTYDIHIRSVEKAFVQPLPSQPVLRFSYDLAGDSLLQQVGDQAAEPAALRDALRALFDEQDISLSDEAVIDRPPQTWRIGYKHPGRAFRQTFTVRRETGPESDDAVSLNVYYPADNFRFALPANLLTAEAATVSPALQAALENGFQTAFNNPNLRLAGELELTTPRQDWRVQDPQTGQTFVLRNQDNKTLEVYEAYPIQVRVRVV